MERACLLPVAVAGALMPDAHVGYGLPIGGVLATENTVIPHAVGVDIACRMKMTGLDIPVSWATTFCSTMRASPQSGSREPRIMRRPLNSLPLGSSRCCETQKTHSR